MARTTSTVVKGAVSVTEMARMVGMSRGHFYSLVKEGVFPAPVYDVRTKRPMFLAEQQQMCLQVRATGVGVDGRYRLFYSERGNGGGPSSRSASARRTGAVPASPNAALIDGLKALGLTTVSEQQVASAVATCFPDGINETEEGVVLRAVWQQLRRTNAA